MKKFSIREIADHVAGEVIGDDSTLIDGLEQIEQARSGQLTFIGSNKYLKYWEKSAASAALVSEGLELDPGTRTLIRVASADLALAQVLELFAPPPPAHSAGVHPTAVVDPTAQIGANVSIGPGCYIGPAAQVGDDCVLYANVNVMDEASIGLRTVLWPGVVIGQRCRVGDDCILHSNTSIGTDGFGYRPSMDKKSLVKIPQIGNVVIGNRVEIGSNTCIDRGKFSSTRIGDGSKIDNLVQIAHNCDIGESCIIAGCVGIGGSVTMGEFATVAAAAGIKDHATIGSHSVIGGGSIVIGDVAPGAFVSGHPAAPHKTTLQQWAAVKKLPGILKNLK